MPTRKEIIAARAAENRAKHGKITPNEQKNDKLKEWYLSLTLNQKIFTTFSTFAVGVIGFAGLTNLATPKQTKAPIQTEAPTAQPSANQPAQSTQTTAQTQSRPTSINAVVEKRGLDFSYVLRGMVTERDQSITLSFIHSHDCGASTPVAQAKNEWSVFFDVKTKTWSDKARSLINCVGMEDKIWTDYSQSAPFTIEKTATKPFCEVTRLKRMAQSSLKMR